MLRVALSPRGLVAALALLLLIAAAILLGRWQWDRTQDILAAERASASQAIPVEEVLADGTAELPNEVIGRPVTAMGEYVSSMQVAVSNREHQGGLGVWIVTGLRLADGRVVAVLRGSLAAADSPGAEPPRGAVTVSGVLQPDERFYADAVVDNGAVASIASSRLASTWSVEVVPGYIALTTQDPASSPAPVPVRATAQTGDVAFPLQNFFYAFQWWFFAIFAVVLYGRWLWLDALREDAPPS
jgi:cytochrome oxidase assembly protein ShyY1